MKAIRWLATLLILVTLSGVVDAATVFPQIYATDAAAEKVLIEPQSRHPRTRDWCGRGSSHDPAKFKVVYNSKHRERDVAFANGYESFINEAIRPILTASCADRAPTSVRLYFYRGDEFEYFDALRYDLLDSDGSPAVVFSDRWVNEKNGLNKAIVANDELGSCNGEPFCDLLGGVYFNAIYRNDEETVRRIDRQISEEMANDAMHQELNQFTSIVTGEKQGIAENTAYLDMLAIYYMGQYNSTFESSDRASCMRPGARQITRKAEVPVVRFEDQFGNDQGATGGWEFGQVYVINKEFVPLCNTICGAGGTDGVNFASNALNSTKLRILLGGVRAMPRLYKCDSPEVRQFEDNFIALTLRSLQWEDESSALIVPENDQPQVSALEQIKAAESEFEAIARRVDARNAAAKGSAHASGASFLAANQQHSDVATTASKLQYTILNPGVGRRPTPQDRVKVYETGTLVDGTVVDDNFRCCGKALTAPMSQLIPGWTEGLQLIGTGGKIRLFIPPELAYGDAGAGAIKPGSVLIYEIELLEILP